MGPGSAILTGIRNSRNDVICFHAADQQLDFRQVAGFIPLLDEHDLVIGSRSGRPGYTKMRLLASHVYIELAHTLFGLAGYDDFNFLYLYRREIFDGMPIESDGVFMCTEMLVRALDAARGSRRSGGMSAAPRRRVDLLQGPGHREDLRRDVRFWWRRETTKPRGGTRRLRGRRCLRAARSQVVLARRTWTEEQVQRGGANGIALRQSFWNVSAAGRSLRSPPR